MALTFAFDITASSLAWAELDGATLLRQGSVADDLAAADANATCDLMARIVRSEASDEVNAIGVAIPGLVYQGDSQGVVCGSDELPSFDGVQLGAELSFRSSLPVTVEGSGSAAALGEHVAGALKGKSVGVALEIGSCISGGIVLKGEVLRGAHALAGSFGRLRHVPFVDEEDRGMTVADACSWQALRAAACAEREGEGRHLATPQEFFAWVETGDEVALRILHAYARSLCALVYNLQCLVDPEVVAVGGSLGSYPALIEALRATMGSMLGSCPVEDMPKPAIVPFGCGQNARLIGAAHVARR